MVNRFIVFSLLVLFFNPKNMLLSSSSETRLFELHSLPHGNLTFLGDSRPLYNEIALTKEDMPINALRSAGVVLYRHPISLVDRHSKKVPSFYTTFAFFIDNMNGNKKAFGDGLAFLISPDEYLLGSPGYLGLVDSTDLTRNRFIAIEFDTRCDSMFHDPDDNHVGLDINSLSSVKLATSSSLGVNLKSGYLITTWIDYKSNERTLEVFLSESKSKPIKPLLKVDIDLSDYLKDNMFVGFSAASEGSTQAAHIEQWEFTVMEINPPPPSPSPPELGTTFTNPYESRQRHRHNHLSRLAFTVIVGLCYVPFVALCGWLCWKKLMAMMQKSDGTNNLEMQTGSARGISSEEVQLSMLFDEVAKGTNMEKVLHNEAELIHVTMVKSSVLLCNSLPPVKPSFLPFCDGLPLRTDDITPV